ncbi:hypothetical protein CVIRNUC_009585 [Coccomyxa viridis]|uniref:Phthiocerol/phthiodiolone dimycocerosyl transferase C-terminal domain-containing protein n=1 Tax=Coccomyxa viridis TaxID=1274662 RepID=A0AAV1IJK3_9CHLO|nr:hypothetical protein CVIRNUC_009585 [Coccomyxa viridis]
MVAPDNSIQRPLRFWEQVCSFMGVSMGFELDGKISPEMIKQAYALLQKEYPYLRCVLTQDNNLLSFVEKTPTPACELKVHTDSLPDFRKTMIDLGNTMRDHTKSIAYLELFSKGEKHILVSTINHAGLDALNAFQIYNSLLTYIGLLSAGKALPEPKPNSFADVLGSIPAAYKKADRLEVPAKFMAQIGADPSAKGSDKGHVEALFTELPKDVTAALIKKSHDKGVTIQGAISAASAVATAACQAKEFPLPQTMLLQCPASVRKQVEPPVTAAQGGQGASLLWWVQDVKSSDTLWTVAKEATTNVKRENAAKGGLAFWARMYADKTMFEAMSQETPSFNPPFTTTASSIGINSIQSAYGPIKVPRAHIMLATYGVTSPTEAGHMTHAHTFNDQLNITFTYSMPAVGDARGKKINATQIAVLKALATGNESATVADFLTITPDASADLISL